MPQLRWQCRRGMRELDELLLRYLENRYPRADEHEKAAFEELLRLPDSELIGYLLQRHACPREFSTVIEHVRSGAPA